MDMAKGGKTSLPSKFLPNGPYLYDKRTFKKKKSEWGFMLVLVCQFLSSRKLDVIGQ